MRYFSYLFLICFICFFEQNVLAQNAKIDSLENLLQNHEQRDTFRVNLLNKIATNISLEQSKKAFIYWNEAISLSKSLNYTKGKAVSYHLIGIHFLHKANYTKAIQYFEKSIKLKNQINDKDGISKSINNIGAIYYYQSNYPKAIEYFQKSLKINEELNNSALISYNLNNIGSIYNHQGNSEEALNYFQKSLKIAQEIGLDEIKSKALHNIGTLSLKEKNYPQALDYFNKSIAIKQKLNDKLGLIVSFQNLGQIYMFQEKYDEALLETQKALQWSLDVDNSVGVCFSYLYIGAVYIKTKENTKALEYTLKSLKIANEKKLLHQQIDIYKQLSEIYASNKNYKAAYDSHRMYKSLNDSIFNDVNLNKITGLEFQYKYDKEKQQAELMQQKKDALLLLDRNRQRILRNSFIVGFILMSFLVLAILRSYIQKQKANKELTYQKMIIEESNEELLQQKSEIQLYVDELQKLNNTKDKFFAIISHDLKSPLSGLKSTSELLFKMYDKLNDEKRKKIISLILQSTNSTFELLENLLTWSLSHLGKIDFEPQTISINFLIEENLKLLTNLAVKKNIQLIPIMSEEIMVFADKNMILTIIRNLISNAIKFTNPGGEVTVGCSKANNMEVNVFVKDTGVGMNKEKIETLFLIENSKSSLGTNKEKGTGLGLVLCKEFIEKNKGKIHVESELGQGSLFSFTLPLSQ